MSTSIRETLLALQERDLAIRAELEFAGTLFQGYHPRMETVHRDNARPLREMIAQIGWQGE